MSMEQVHVRENDEAGEVQADIDSLNDDQVRELARERLGSLQETENQIDSLVNGLPSSPEKRQLSDAIVTQRSQIHKLGKDIGNGVFEGDIESTKNDVLQLPNILFKIIEMIQNIFSPNKVQDREEYSHADVSNRDSEPLSQTRVDSPQDENGFVLARIIDAAKNIVEATISGESYRFLHDADQGFLTTNKHTNLALKDAPICFEDNYFIPFRNTGFISVPGGVKTIHVEVGGDFYESSCALLESYLGKQNTDLQHAFLEKKNVVAWLSEKDFTSFPYIAACGELLMLYEESSDDTFVTMELQQRLNDFLDICPGILPISRAEISSPEKLEENFQNVREAFHTMLEKQF